jgi:hypothetical protein
MSDSGVVDHRKTATFGAQITLLKFKHTFEEYEREILDSSEANHPILLICRRDLFGVFRKDDVQVEIKENIDAGPTMASERLVFPSVFSLDGYISCKMSENFQIDRKKKVTTLKSSVFTVKFEFHHDINREPMLEALEKWKAEAAMWAGHKEADSIASASDIAQQEALRTTNALKFRSGLVASHMKSKALRRQVAPPEIELPDKGGLAVDADEEDVIRDYHHKRFLVDGVKEEPLKEYKTRHPRLEKAWSSSVDVLVENYRIRHDEKNRQLEEDGFVEQESKEWKIGEKEKDGEAFLERTSFATLYGGQLTNIAIERGDKDHLRADIPPDAPSRTQEQLVTLGSRLKSGISALMASHTFVPKLIWYFLLHDQCQSMTSDPLTIESWMFRAWSGISFFDVKCDSKRAVLRISPEGFSVYSDDTVLHHAKLSKIVNVSVQLGAGSDEIGLGASGEYIALKVAKLSSRKLLILLLRGCMKQHEIESGLQIPLSFLNDKQLVAGAKEGTLLKREGCIALVIARFEEMTTGLYARKDMLMLALITPHWLSLFGAGGRVSFEMRWPERFQWFHVEGRSSDDTLVIRMRYVNEQSKDVFRVFELQGFNCHLNVAALTALFHSRISAVVQQVSKWELLRKILFENQEVNENERRQNGERLLEGVVQALDGSENKVGINSSSLLYTMVSEFVLLSRELPAIWDQFARHQFYRRNCCLPFYLRDLLCNGDSKLLGKEKFLMLPSCVACKLLISLSDSNIAIHTSSNNNEDSCVLNAPLTDARATLGVFTLPGSSEVPCINIFTANGDCFVLGLDGCNDIVHFAELALLIDLLAFNPGATSAKITDLLQPAVRERIVEMVSVCLPTEQQLAKAKICSRTPDVNVLFDRMQTLENSSEGGKLALTDRTVAESATNSITSTIAAEASKSEQKGAKASEIVWDFVNIRDETEIIYARAKCRKMFRVASFAVLAMIKLQSYHATTRSLEKDFKRKLREDRKVALQRDVSRAKKRMQELELKRRDRQ